VPFAAFSICGIFKITAQNTTSSAEHFSKSNYFKTWLKIPLQARNFFSKNSQKNPNFKNSQKIPRKFPENSKFQIPRKFPENSQKFPEIPRNFQKFPVSHGVTPVFLV
jgi:hypothetical protein